MEGTVSLNFTVFLHVLESLERMLGVAFSREVRQKGPWPWELFRLSERLSGEEDGGLRSSNWEQEADVCYFLPWALGVWELSRLPPPREAEGGDGTELHGKTSSECSVWEGTGESGVAASGLDPVGGDVGVCVGSLHKGGDG